jgi:cobalt-zinc-cadmium efflux system outer membrane protein
MTESEAIRRFEQENARLQALSAQVREVRAETRTWSLPPNPGVTYTREDAAGNRDDFLLVEQSLPWSGRLSYLRRAGDSAARAAEAEAGWGVLRLRSDLRTAFYGLLLAQEKAALIGSWVDQFKEVVRVLKEREAEKEVSAFDRLRAERELADAESERISARVLLVQAQTGLASFWAPGAASAPLVVKGEFAAGAALPALEELTARSLSVRGDALSVRYRTERFEYERRAARRLLIPEPVLSAGFKRTEIPGLSDTGFVLSMTLPLPLFNRGRADADRARASADLSRAEAAAIRRQIETDVGAAYETLLLRRRVAAEYARALGEAGTELSRIGRLAYDEGERGILELLDAYRVALSSRLQALALAWAAKQAEIDLNRVVGEEVLL